MTTQSETLALASAWMRGDNAAMRATFLNIAAQARMRNDGRGRNLLC